MLKSPEGPKEKRGLLEKLPVLGSFIYPYPIREEGELSPIQKMTRRKQDENVSRIAKKAYLGGTLAFVLFEIANTCQFLSSR